MARLALLPGAKGANGREGTGRGAKVGNGIDVSAKKLPAGHMIDTGGKGKYGVHDRQRPSQTAYDKADGHACRVEHHRRAFHSMDGAKTETRRTSLLRNTRRWGRRAIAHRVHIPRRLMYAGRRVDKSCRSHLGLIYGPPCLLISGNFHVGTSEVRIFLPANSAESSKSLRHDFCPPPGWLPTGRPDATRSWPLRRSA